MLDGADEGISAELVAALAQDPDIDGRERRSTG